MVVDSADPNTLYLAANPLQVSHDGGATFKPITASFEAGKRGAVQLWTDLARPGTVYAGAFNGAKVDIEWICLALSWCTAVRTRVTAGIWWSLN